MGDLVFNRPFDFSHIVHGSDVFLFAGAHIRVGCVMLLLLTVCNGKFYKISLCSSYIIIFVTSLRTHG